MFNIISLLKKYKISCVNVEFIGKLLKAKKENCIIDAFEDENQIALVISGTGIILNKNEIKAVAYENDSINIVSKENEKIILKKC